MILYHSKISPIIHLNSFKVKNYIFFVFNNLCPSLNHLNIIITRKLYPPRPCARLRDNVGKWNNENMKLLITAKHRIRLYIYNIYNIYDIYINIIYI